MFGLLLGFSFGLAVGAWIGRREGRKETLAQIAGLGADPAAALPLAPPPLAAAPLVAPAAPPTAAPPTPVPPIVVPPIVAPPPVVPLPARLPPLATPNKKAKKKGLTEADFQPRDDILIRMQEAWERGEHLGPPPDGGTGLDPEADERVRRLLARLEGDDPGQGSGSMPEEPAPTAPPSAGTLTEGTVELAELGYGEDLRFADGVLFCRRCEQTHDADAAEVEQVRRYEGQSDPGDEAILLGLRCPHCGAKGSIVSTYGPDADPALAEAFTYLASRARHG
jgi:hypothetical protein